MKHISTYENFNHFWQDLGLSQLPQMPISDKERDEIKKRQMIYGRSRLMDCPRCGGRSVLKSSHKCGSDELDLEEGD